MWNLIVSVPDHCLSFYFSQYCSHLFPDINNVFPNHSVCSISRVPNYTNKKSETQSLYNIISQKFNGSNNSLYQSLLPTDTLS